MSSDEGTSIASGKDLKSDGNDMTNGQDEDGGGLFGSDSEEEEVIHKRRKLSDSEPDSGDNEGRKDRHEDGLDGDEKDADGKTRPANVLAASIGRHPDPKPSDGELYMLQLPNSIGIAPQCFTLKTFQPPKTDHDSFDSPSATFSAYHTSLNTIRWRHSPSDPTKVQSNARILRWSDGSLTLQLASNPREQLELVAKSLAHPQINPKKPTPTSVSQSRSAPPQPYSSRLDSHNYLMAPYESAELLRVTNQITTSLAVQSIDQDDEALARLQMQLAAAQKGNKANPDGGLALINITEDPELDKKRAEQAEKEKIKMQRRLESQRERENTRNNNVLRRSGLRTGGMGAGLTVGGLEDDDGMTGAARGRVAKPKRPKPRRRNSEYSDESDFDARGRTREDEYDEDDGFLVRSDEEPEVGEESEEEAEMEDADAEGDEDVDQQDKGVAAKKRETEEAGAGRGKRRRVVMDEDEEE